MFVKWKTICWHYILWTSIRDFKVALSFLHTLLSLLIGLRPGHDKKSSFSGSVLDFFSRSIYVSSFDRHFTLYKLELHPSSFSSTNWHIFDLDIQKLPNFIQVCIRFTLPLWYIQNEMWEKTDLKSVFHTFFILSWKILISIRYFLEE